MRRVLYDRSGEPQAYLTGAGVLFDLANRPVATLQDGTLLDRRGRVIAWFDGSFVWTEQGVLLFIKGAESQSSLTLPKTLPLRTKLEPTPAPFFPLLLRTEPPPLRWVWSEMPWAEVFELGARA